LCALHIFFLMVFHCTRFLSNYQSFNIYILFILFFNDSHRLVWWTWHSWSHSLWNTSVQTKLTLFFSPTHAILWHWKGDFFCLSIIIETNHESCLFDWLLDYSIWQPHSLCCYCMHFLLFGFLLGVIICIPCNFVVFLEKFSINESCMLEDSNRASHVWLDAAACDCLQY
jgi:hypothetical protein